MRNLAFSSIILAAICPAASAATLEQIGSWVLSCPADETCVLRLNNRFLNAGVTADLEVQAQGGMLVPVIAVRGPSSEILAAAALAGNTTATLQFPGGPALELSCGASNTGYFCAPKDDAAQKLAAQLPRARSVTVRVSVAVNGLPLRPQERSVDLSGTSEALAKLRKAGPAQVPSTSSQSPMALTGMADKALKASGYPNGIADLQALMAKFLKKTNEVK